MVNFSERLKEALAESGIKSPKTALAAHMGVHSPAVSRWLNGSIPKAESLDKIATFLNVDVKWLLTGDGQRKVPDMKAPPSLVQEDPAPYHSGHPETIAESAAKIAVALDRIASALEEISKSR